MALFRRSKKKGRRGGGLLSPFKAGVIAIVVITLVTVWVFTKYNPFADPYEMQALFATANNLKAKSPVRIAGVNVGEVKEVKPMPDGSGAAMVKMEITENGLPLHEDAELKVRPRIFLEGNFFVDVQPGSPSSPVLKQGGTIPVTQTSAPVQFGQLLTALQSDTREDLRTFLAEYSLNGLKGAGARGFNRSIQYWEEAYKNTALANQALLGTEEGDLGRVLRGQAGVAKALTQNPEKLKDFVSDFNTTAAAFAREDDNLEATIPALRDVLRTGEPALASLNGALPSLSAFARDATPGTRSSGPTIEATIPFLRELRGLVSEPELRGLVADLRPTIPALARLNRDTIPFLEQNRLLSSCTNRVLLPFAKEPIPDPDFAADGGSGEPFYKVSNRALVGLAGESRTGDANSQFFRIVGSSGAMTQLNVSEGTRFFSQNSGMNGVRPDRPGTVGADNQARLRDGTPGQPPFRPDVPCETQQPPDLNAPLGPADNEVQVVPDPSIDVFGLPVGLPISRELDKLRRQNVKDVAAGRTEFSLSPEQVLVEPTPEAKRLAERVSALAKGELAPDPAGADDAKRPQVGDRP